MLDIAAEYRRRKDPIDNIVQDWFYWDPYPWGSHKFDPKRYPDPAAAFATLHDEGFHVMISVWGTFNAGSESNPNPNYQALDAKGFFYPPAVRSDNRFYDAFNPAARELYWDQVRDQIWSKGVDAWWLDASEPEANMAELRKTTTGLGPGALVLNAWPLMHTTGVSDGQLRDAPDKRVFILTRSAFAGQQRTGAATWSGDITGDWPVLKRQISAGLNFCLSGIPYWTTDIGGFFVNYPGGCSNPEYRELYTRWFEFGAFCPIFRSHGTSTPREMWRFGPETESTLLKYDRLRYRLLPYIYSMAWNVTKNGGTLMRALVMDFPKDPKALAVQDEFLFGPSILVCPVTDKGASSRQVYLPRGTGWTDFWTGRRLEGGQTIEASAPIDTLPLYVRDGSIIPLGPDLQYTSEEPADPLELRIYAGRNASFTLYEDEGDNNGYKQGRHSTIRFLWDESKKQLVIGNQNGEFPGMLHERRLNVDLLKPGEGGVDPAAGSQSVQYKGAAVSVSP